MTLKGMIVFAILMENDQGILNKSPKYILEKFGACNGIDDEFLEQLLSLDNKQKLETYIEKWDPKLEPSQIEKRQVLTDEETA